MSYNFQVWDRRCFAESGKPAGFLEGHLEGITFIDSRGDGHYFISNSKDQTTKLWDIRRMSSTTKSYVTGAIAAKLAWHNDAIRDCSWHPYFPVLVSSSWDHVVARWEFPGSPADSPA
ncbi:hypothetical protein B296_00015041 [Ensete ventricosum]|uniref:Uncharacterized protein n=1 Tax=Ensete ventricosum TaxID=4639 RepID=A0A427ATX7_ENSVE|nr:hypothetical protein B296_00015041 [Ensete ventricosum]